MNDKLMQLGVLVLIVAGFVVLTVTGEDTGEFVAFLGPLVAGLFVVQRVESRSNNQDEVLHQIHRQTNGVLDQRIKEGVQAALDERDGGAR